MKIQRVIIHNITSIKDADINFEATPLCDSDVFLITGDTGTGKTTILDAICLALFNNTPRLSSKKNERVPTDIDNITLLDTRRMMRRGTGEAYIDLYFESNGCNYLAKWQVQRGKTCKPNLQLGSVNRLFKNRTQNKTITSCNNNSEKDLQKEIQDVIGLDFEQFCRTTMLAQNQFTQFLESDPTSRAEILEKITQTSEFSKIGSRLYEQISQKEEEWKQAQIEASDTGLSDEEIKEKEAQKGVLTEQSNVKSAELKTASNKKEWLDNYLKLQESIKLSKIEFEKANNLLNSEEYKANCLFVNQWNASIEARQWLADKNRTTTELDNSKQALKNIETRFIELLDGYAYEECKLKRYEEEEKEVKEYILQNSNKETTFTSTQTIIAHLNSVITKREKIVELKKAIENEKENQNQLEIKCNEAKNNFEKIKADKEIKDSQIVNHEEKLNSINLSGLRKVKDETIAHLNLLDKAIEGIEGIETAIKMFEKEEKEIKNLNDEIKAMSATIEDKILIEYNNAALKRELTKSGYYNLRNSVDNYAKQMRAQLTLGCECPVCRQVINSLPNENQLDEIFKKAHEEYNLAEECFKTIEEKKNRAEADVKSKRELLERSIKKHSENKSVEQAKEKVKEIFEKIKLNLKQDNPKAILNDEIERYEKKKKGIEIEIKNGEDIEKALSTLRKELKKVEKSVEKERNNFESATKDKESSKLKIDKWENQVIECKKDISLAKNEVEPLIDEHLWEIDWKDNTKSFIEELEKQSYAYEEKRKRKIELEKNIEPMRKILKENRNIIEQIRGKIPSWAVIVSKKEIKCQDLSSAINKMFEDVTKIMAAIESAEKQLAILTTNLQEFESKNPELTELRLALLDKRKSIDDLTATLESQRAKPNEMRALLDKAEKDLLQHQENKPNIDENDSIESLNANIEAIQNLINQLNREIGSVEKEIADDNLKKIKSAALKEKAEKCLKEYERWSRLKCISDKEGKKLRDIAQSYIFENILQSANEYLKKLEPRYNLKTVPGTLYSALEDAHLGFSSRDTGSLSGGESFLVSLALALALSDVGQGLSVDTLFIDEGFGSLSGTPLANAINILRSLKGSNGRHVGIISHMQQVRENIPVQIRVNKTVDGSSSTIEIVP